MQKKYNPSFFNSSLFLAFLGGVCGTLTLPPFYFFPLLVPAYGGLYYLLVRTSRIYEAAKIGFFWGWGFFITGLYWFAIALMTDPDRFAWLIPFAVFALTAVIALYTSLFAALFFYIRRTLCNTNNASPVGALLFALLWTLVEYARGHLFTGFPWNLGGYVFAISDVSIQLASLVGIYGLTFMAVLLGVVCVTQKRLAIACFILLAAGLGWGAWRANTAPHEFVAGVNLRLVQGNIQQHHKWKSAHQMEGLQTYLALSQSSASEGITHIIWPETAIPYVLADHSTLARRLGNSLLPGQYLLAGALRASGEDVTNTIAVISSQGEILGSYDKHKLVPFGEFLPLRWLIPDALETPVGMRDMASGKGLRTLAWPGLPAVSPLICYEVIFPEYAVGEDTHPEWLLSVTNDAWFGNSTAPYQHLAMARMRAVERGLPIIRVANTGITAIYDAYGREVVRIPLNQKGFIDSRLPKMSYNGTVYTRWIPRLLRDN